MSEFQVEQIARDVKVLQIYVGPTKSRSRTSQRTCCVADTLAFRSVLCVALRWSLGLCVDSALGEHQEAGDHNHRPTDEQDLVPSALVRQNCKSPHSWGSYAQA